MKVITGEPICNSPLNHSKSKFMYSFGKAERFPSVGRNYYTGNFFYNLPAVRMTRSTSLGYGNKFDFTSGSKSKSPVFYDPQSDFNQKNPYAPRYSFGLGRDRMYQSHDKAGPGPAKYNTLKPFGKDGIKFSMRIKYNRSSSLADFGSPGPGTYSITTKINPNGVYSSSKHENVHPVEFSKDKSKRFNYQYNNTPGPSDYQKCSLFGKIFDSRFKSTNGISMRSRYKVVDSREHYPGPGAYKSFSEFGIYEKTDIVSNSQNQNRSVKKAQNHETKTEEGNN
jgi:hypothetical protein